MLKNNKKIKDLVYKEISESALKDVSFTEYLKLTEAPFQSNLGTATPPAQTSSMQPAPQASSPQQNNQSTNNNAMSWDGKSPLQPNMTVSVMDPTTKQNVPVQVSQVDSNAGGVKVKNANGQEQWYNKADLQPTIGQKVAGAAQQMAGAFKQGMAATQTTEDAHLSRLKELAGIQEMSSGGCTSAGSIATAPNIIGDTSHTPTDHLGKKMRLKRLKKKKE